MVSCESGSLHGSTHLVYLSTVHAASEYCCGGLWHRCSAYSLGTYHQLLLSTGRLGFRSLYAEKTLSRIHKRKWYLVINEHSSLFFPRDLLRTAELDRTYPHDARISHRYCLARSYSLKILTLWYSLEFYRILCNSWEPKCSRAVIEALL